MQLFLCFFHLFECVLLYAVADWKIIILLWSSTSYPDRRDNVVFPIIFSIRKGYITCGVDTNSDVTRHQLGSQLHEHFFFNYVCARVYFNRLKNNFFGYSTIYVDRINYLISVFLSYWINRKKIKLVWGKKAEQGLADCFEIYQTH